jgi:hypothetical protein
VTFLHPILLWALPLVFLPVLIHFLNRLRHRPQPWAAMRFLISATRNSASHTRLRQFLILLFRVLCVLMLIVFLARPLAGGWLGWALSPAPDAILILLDRSASMETRAGNSTRREQALKMLTEAAIPFEQSSHLVLIDSATRQSQDLARASDLARLPVTRPTDTAADVPAMLRAAFNWLVENRAGSAEIWIASDSQRSNWLPEDPRWKDLVAQLSALTQRIRIRYLALDSPADANGSVSLKELVRHQAGGKSELQFLLDIQRNRGSSAPIPVAMSLDGVKSQMEAAMDGQSLRWRQRVELGAHTNGGWGAFQLPDDANSRDNTAYFVYGPDIAMRAAIVHGDTEASRCLQFACAGRAGQPAEAVAESEFPGAKLAEHSLVVWQEPLPSGASAERLRAFAEEGGVVVFFPPGKPDAQQFNAVGWGDVQDAEADKSFRILRWDEDQGPLARSDERLSLPLPQVTFARRQQLAGPKTVLAAFEDGSTFLARQIAGKGEVYFCASLPDGDWSTLSDGSVLVPMMQRMLQSGARRLQSVSFGECGGLSAADLSREWESVDSPGKDIRFQAGVYRSGDRMMAVNRPAAEDEVDLLDMDQARKLFGGLPFQPFQERSAAGPLDGEVWRVFLFAMLALLIGEAILILPAPKTPDAPAGGSAS